MYTFPERDDLSRRSQTSFSLPSTRFHYITLLSLNDLRSDAQAQYCLRAISVKTDSTQSATNNWPYNPMISSFSTSWVAKQISSSWSLVAETRTHAHRRDSTAGAGEGGGRTVPISLHGPSLTQRPQIGASLQTSQRSDRWRSYFEILLMLLLLPPSCWLALWVPCYTAIWTCTLSVRAVEVEEGRKYVIATKCTRTSWTS